MESKAKIWTRFVLGVSFFGVGVVHFVTSDPFVSIMPPYLPWHLELVYLSGIFEILGGLGILLERTRRFSAWGLLALLVAVYPANIHMLVNDVYIEGFPKSRLGLWLRMPLQFGWMFLVYWSCNLRTKSPPGT